MVYLQTTKIIRTGNSLCAVLPKNILQAANLSRGDQVAFGITNENIITIHKLTVSELAIINPPQI